MKQSIRKALPQLILVILIGIGCAVLEGYLSITMMRAIDSVTLGNKELFKEEILRIVIITIGLFPLYFLLSFSKGLYKRKAIVSAKVNYIKGVFKKNINEFQRDNNALYVSALTNDVNTLEANYIDGIYEVVLGIINAIVAIVVISYVSPIALGMGIFISVTSTIISIRLSKPLQKHQTQRSQLYEGYTSYIKEVLSAFHIIKSNNLSSKIQNDYNNKSSEIQQKGYIIDKIYTYIISLQHFNFKLSLYGLVAISAYMAIKGSITLGGTILIVNNMERVMHPLMTLGEWMPKIISTKSLFNKIDETLKNMDHHQETLTLESFTNSIDFNNVSFSYENNEVLKEINLSIKKGEKYLIIGPSGGGKSTLLKLIRKYFPPQKGDISIDGLPFHDVTKGSYFSHISNVEQQVFLFEDTLRNNISLYKGYSDEEVLAAIEQSGLKDFIEAQPLGLDTVIYDNGKNISGGEKSRIAIARGLLHKADILFLDEAFASLDSKVAKEIECTLLNLRGITVINVSHVIFEESKKQYDHIYMVRDQSIYSIEA